ncbi:MAG: PDZ domain-containing protein [Ruminococcaceae bacterium]|nr:PDZ domain-containing protein [Oscillospiraceae bacterium]
MFDNNPFPGSDQKPEGMNDNPVQQENGSAQPEPEQQATYQQTSYQQTPPPNFGAPYGMPPTPPQPPKKPKNKLVGWIIALAVLYFLMLAGIFVAIGTGVLNSADSGKETEKNAAQGNADADDNGKKTSEKNEGEKTKEDKKDNPPLEPNTLKEDPEAMTATELYKENVESVVFVEANYARGQATGSGFVIDAKNGYILTNYHVVEESDDIAVTFSNSDSYDAELIAGDEINDVAVLQIKAEDLTAVYIGDSDSILIGDDVLVIGNPLGDLTFTLTRGVVSGTERDINTGEYTINTFQTDAAINSGNSGGPAFNATGEVIGIASAKYAATGVEGIGFCIPINDAMAIAEDLIEFGYVKGRPNFGISVSDSPGYEYVTDERGRRVLVETAYGARIEEVGKDSCAADAGLKPGDIVTKLDKTKIENANDLINAKNQHKAGDTVTLEVYRDGETIELEVTLDEYSPE